MKRLKCPSCNSELHLSLAYDGCDWETVAGEGSGYDYPLYLSCHNPGCRSVYHLGRLKRQEDFSEVVENMRPYTGRLND